MAGQTDIKGFTAPGFEVVREAFAANFRLEGDYQEIGAALAAFHKGKVVVDLWGGWADPARMRPWEHDTLINVWSATKGATAAAMAVLVDRKLIAYDDLVSSVLPEFGQAGKAGVTIAELMSHQAGLPGFVETTEARDQLDFAGCVAKLERQSPAWPPGTQSSYHAMTFGWLAGEVIRRVSGRSPGQFLAEAVAGPLKADVFIGLPDALDRRAAVIFPPKSSPAVPDLAPAALMALVNPQQDPSFPNQRAWRAAEIPAASGQASALGLARLYAALGGGGALEGARVLSPSTVARMTAPATCDGRQDLFLGFVDCWGMGVALNRPGIYGPNPRAFGHSGWGGSFGCADPDAEISIGYVCNQMGPDLVGDPRTGPLCAAILHSAARR